MKLTPEQFVERRFWRHVKRGKPGECWHWRGASAGRYGAFVGVRGGPSISAHRYSYALHHGAIPAGLVIDHLCCNTRCVNPLHLDLVSRRENSLRTTTHAGMIRSRNILRWRLRPYPAVNARMFAGP